MNARGIGKMQETKNVSVSEKLIMLCKEAEDGLGGYLFDIEEDSHIVRAYVQGRADLANEILRLLGETED